MERTFVYGMAVSGNNFTDRVKETKRIISNFENGINTILISPRRMGKTSLINKVCSSIDKPGIVTVRMDVYNCRSEYDFYNTFCSEILRQTSSKIEQALEAIKEFLGRIAPKISISPDMTSEYSLSLGLSPKNISPECILSLPEKIAEKHGYHIIICIDEFQQIGEFPDSLNVQKKLRSIWQHFKNVSFCFYGSKKHMMLKIFQNRRMPFYQFGELITLDRIPTYDWIEYIESRFKENGKCISAVYAEKICNSVDNYSSYVQQLSWNVFVNTEDEVDDAAFDNAMSDMMSQCSALFVQQIEGLTSYQMNFLKAICDDVHSDFTSRNVLEDYNLGSKSNISRIKTTLQEKELIECREDGIYIADPMLKLYLKNELK